MLESNQIFSAFKCHRSRKTTTTTSNSNNNTAKCVAMSKTIETHLQSNEVRIPKKSSGTEFDVSATAAPCQYFKSSFARSLSFSQGGQGQYGGDQNHFTRSLDFEVNYGLSTIPDGGGGGSSQTTPSASPVFDPPELGHGGRTTKVTNGISAANGGVVKTLWNYGKGSPSKSASPGGTPSKLASGAAVAASTASAAMSGSGSSSSTRKSVEANEIEVLRLRKECQNLIEENRRLVNLAANSGYAINGLMNGNGGHGGHGGGSSGSSSLTSSLGLGLAGGGGGAGAAAATVAGMYSTVESVILQTQVETLQWQLKQVDSSRQMYRAVMEEVVRYLDRCYRSLDVIGTNGSTNIGRSKSVLQVSRVPSSSSSSIHHNHDSDSSNASSPRARSSTNLIDVQQKSQSYTKKQHQLQQQQQQSQPGSTTTVNGTTAVTNGNHNAMLLDEDSVVSPSPAGSYSTFRDFTWRRSPKRQPNQLPATLPISGAEVDPEKLAQEAFRLLRTVQNLLNTQEPTLSSQSSSSSAELDSLLLLAGASVGGGGGSTTGSTTTLTGAGAVASAPVVNTRSNVGFSRKLNMRGSRLSLRSSTDDSVHSTSSSNNEDNTDRPSPPLGHHLNHHLNHHHHPGSSSSSSTSSSSGHLVNHRHSANIDRIKEMMIASSAEDESGFSSMNSFQEIGLPLVNSTMLSTNSSAASSTGSVSFVSDESSDLRDATVIPTSNVTTIAINPPKLGIPASKAPEIPARVTQSAAYEHHNHFVNHRRWDSAPVVLPQKLKIHQNGGGGGAGGDSDSGVSSRVLWV